MNGKTILSSPVTQTSAAVKQLIIFQNHGQEPAEMAAFYKLSADMVLVRNNKGDAYYVTTPKSCSCPAATYNPGHPCKHARKYFPQPKREVSALAMDSIRPEGKWHGRNGPWIEDKVKATGGGLNGRLYPFLRANGRGTLGALGTSHRHPAGRAERDCHSLRF